MSAVNKNSILRRLPQVDFLTRAGADPTAARAVIEELRRAILADEITEIPDFDTIMAQISDFSANSAKFRLRRVINATGIVLHTNLGRAPLAQSVADHVASVAAGYCNLEYNLDKGRRGSRMDAVQARLSGLCGAEAAVCVNNNAAAVLLVLSALCAGGEVIVSRGELVEIGGSFRVPDVISQGGATLVEVGTTNKTRITDYEKAINQHTAAILKVHTSNYRIMGFTEESSLPELADLAATNGSLPLIYDLGGGALVDLSSHEPMVQNIMKQGVDVLCFSGDKLLGGPQCGIIIGKAQYIDMLARHPLYRALRMDKLTLAALEATLMLYEKGEPHKIPTLAMLQKSDDELKHAAQFLAESVLVDAVVIETEGQAGGGSLPTEVFMSYAVAFSGDLMPLHVLEQRLRRWNTPIVARIHKDKLLIDVRTVSPDELEIIIEAINSIFGGAHGK